MKKITQTSFGTREQKLLVDKSALRFNRQYIWRSDNIVHLHPRPYVPKFPSEKIERSPESLMSHRGQAAYDSSCTRLDVACAVNQLTQVLPDTPKESDFMHIDALFKRMREFDVELKYGNVDLETVKIYVYANASFAMKRNLTSQMGQVMK